MSVITRFAPSPTGFLHIGNIRAALVNWLYAKQNKGKFILRIDDTDLERSKTEYEDAIKRDLEWLGLVWDGYEKQSARLNRYQEVMAQLTQQKILYPCFETKDELDTKRKLQIKRGLPPIYDRAALNLSEAEIASLLKSHKPHYRFKIPNEPIEWQDMIYGKVNFEGKNISDPILVREDGTFPYMLCSTVDDIDFKVTHIIRGADHISNTAIQYKIFEALGIKVPDFAHMALFKTEEAKISKREGGHDIASLREFGIEPMAILSYLARLGSSQPVEALSSLDELVQSFSITSLGKATVIYDPEFLQGFNHKILVNLDFTDVKQRLAIEGFDEKFWEIVKFNIKTLDEAKDWWRICHANISPVIENKPYLLTAANLLPKTLDNNSWDVWTKELRNKTGFKGKELFMPLRKAITGQEHGPELKILLPMIGYEKVYKRLLGELA